MEFEFFVKLKNEIDGFVLILNKFVECFIIYEELEEDIEKKGEYGLVCFFECIGNINCFWVVLRKFCKDWDR